MRRITSGQKVVAASILAAIILGCIVAALWARRNRLGAPPPGQRWRVSATLQSQHVRVGGFIHVILRATHTSGPLGRGYAGWPPWWMVWRIRSPGAVREPVASGAFTPGPRVGPGQARVWDAWLYVRKGGGNRTLTFGLKTWADRYVIRNVKEASGFVARVIWRPHTPPAGILWTKPLHLIFSKVGGLPPAAAGGPLQVGVRLQSYHPKANRQIKVTLIVKNVSRHPTTFWAMSCSWNTQWTDDATGVGWWMRCCDSNFPVAHRLAPGAVWTGKDKLTFRPWPRVYSFRVGFTPLAAPFSRLGQKMQRTYWSAPIRVTIRP